MRRITIGNTKSIARVEVGEGLETKVNLIVGANSIHLAAAEREKIDAAALLGVHTIIDLSTVRLEQPLWAYGQERHPSVAFGKVAPILVAKENGGDVLPQKLWHEIEAAVLAGVDYLTLNLVPMRLRDVGQAVSRACLTTSRQGGVLLNHMMRHRVDNPYEAIFEDILALFKEYRVTMHIGSTFRPSSVTEAYDDVHRWELRQQMDLYRVVDAAGVQAIVEPMSHQPLKDIGPGIDRLRAEYGSYVPFQMLGPIVTEVNLDCDQYAAASGAAMAAMQNVGKITTIPPREHVEFPTLQDTIEGIKATLTSVHAGDMCRLPDLLEQDRAIARGRAASRSCNPDAVTPGCNKCLELCPLLVRQPEQNDDGPKLGAG